MKRSERQHLKQNELVTSLSRASEVVAERRRMLLGGLAVLMVLLVAVAGWAVWRSRANAAASELLAEGMMILEAPVVPPAPATPATPAPASDATAPGSEAEPTPEEAATAPAAPTPAAPTAGSYPTEREKLEAALPKLLEAAAEYPSTPAGLAARYHAAGVLAELGRVEEAQGRYQEVIDRAGNSVYGRMARLGLAEAQARAGNYDLAIATWEAIVSEPADAAGDVPLDGVLMQLGRTYERAGKTSEAIQTYQRIVDEFPDSLYATVAQAQLDQLKTP